MKNETNSINKQNKEQDAINESVEENVLPPENIVVLNELRSASDLNRLISSNSIEIQPDFQREEVWSDDERARFIDSLSKEFPIPSMCFALDPKEQKFIVIDGLQRMSTIKKFLNEQDWILPNLKDIDERLSGKKVNKIKTESPEIYRRIENISLPLTILRYDPSRSDNMDYIFTIFQRLNTCGIQLNNQEIRNAIYQGPFNDFIKQCAKNNEWVSIVKSKKKERSKRMISEERVLRFFAFLENLDKYNGQLNKFLNDYMTENRYRKDCADLKKIFEQVVKLVSSVDVVKVAKSNAFRDAVLYGVAKNINKLSGRTPVELLNLIEDLEADEHFSQDALSQAVMKKVKVQERLSVAKKIFGK